MTAAELLAAMDPEVVRLAASVSLAVRVGPALLRTARLELAPRAPMSAESELWFGPLVESFGNAGFVFRPDAATELRGKLASDPAWLEAAWALAKSFHPWVSPAIAVEEELAYLSLTDGKSTAKMNALVGSVVRAMKEDSTRAITLARWATRAVPRLPAEVKELANAPHLWLAASVELGMPATPDKAPSGAAIDRTLAERLGEHRARFDWVDGALVFRKSGMHEIAVPKTKPPMVRVSWGRKYAHHVRGSVEIGSRIAISPTATELRIEAVDGRRWRLRRDDVSPTPGVPSLPKAPPMIKWVGAFDVANLVRQIDERPSVSFVYGDRCSGKTAFFREVVRRHTREDASLWDWPVCMVTTNARDVEDLRHDVLFAAARVVDQSARSGHDEARLLGCLRSSGIKVVVLVDEQLPRSREHFSRCVDAMTALAFEAPLSIVLATSWRSTEHAALPEPFEIRPLDAEAARQLASQRETLFSEDVARLLALTAGNAGLFAHGLEEVARGLWDYDHWDGALGSHLRLLTPWLSRHAGLGGLLFSTAVHGRDVADDLMETGAVIESIPSMLAVAAPLFRHLPPLRHDLLLVATRDSRLAQGLAERVDGVVLASTYSGLAGDDVMRTTRRCVFIVDADTVKDDWVNSCAAAAARAAWTEPGFQAVSVVIDRTATIPTALARLRNVPIPPDGDVAHVLETFRGVAPPEQRQADRQGLFVSCALEDRADVAPIVEALRDAGIDVFYNPHPGPPNEPRSHWDQYVTERITTAALFMPFISANSEAAESAAFQEEWKSAAEQAERLLPNTAFLLPVALDEVSIANARVPEAFKLAQWYRFVRRTASATTQFVDFVLSAYRATAALRLAP